MRPFFLFGRCHSYKKNVWVKFIYSFNHFLTVFVVKLLNPGYFIPGFAAMMITIIFFGGVQLLALGVIGDPAAIPALQRRIDRERDGRVRRRSKEIVRDLGEGAPLAEDVRRLRDEVSELRAIAGKLRERVELLEAKDQSPVSTHRPLRSARRGRGRRRRAHRRDDLGGAQQHH